VETSQLFLRDTLILHTIDRSLSHAFNLLVAFTTSIEKGRGAILLFYPGHHTRHHNVYVINLLFYNGEEISILNTVCANVVKSSVATSVPTP
jgi:hypothetical protein